MRRHTRLPKTCMAATAIKREKRIAENLFEQIHTFNSQKQNLEKQKDQLDKLNIQLVEIRNTIKDTERKILSLQEQLNQYTSEQQKANGSLADVENLLSSYFASKGWFGHWKETPEVFIKQINDFSELWKSNNKLLEENSGKHNILLATLKNLNDVVQRLLVEKNKKVNTLTALQLQKDDLVNKRKSFFNGEEVLKVEADFKLAIDAARQTIDKHRIANDKLTNELTRVITQKTQTEEDAKKLQQHISEFTRTIDQWLISFNSQFSSAMDENGLVQLLALTPEWIQTERKELRAIDDAVTQSLSVLNERKAAQEKHAEKRMSERPVDELQILLNDIKIIFQKNNQDVNDIDYSLRLDETNKQKIGDLLKSIEAKALIAENWAKLNDIIGSADGKKFRQIAQEYTLDVLLGFANMHLEMLSKRYLLQRIPGSVGLQVLDQDMGDEIRTVFSLSGGESFLVSLALALGLASLSSNRMQVESLFIDEGFGSLDPETLNIAMDALERLHNQGRKVGVISHVQEMTERIPVQIKVSKQQSGKSKVEVIGF
ncbi:MAG: hypothetical protein IPL09_03980 [Bacteroidetes bacterium]|nr:hypothetical protein [Bacteroidota bacterium]